MALRMSAQYVRSYAFHLGLNASILSLLCALSAVWGSQVQVQPKISAVLGKNVTLGCGVQVGANLSLTQSSWERTLKSGSVTLAVYNPMFGISISPDYKHRLSFRSPSAYDATIILEDVGFADMGIYTCKVATFPLGNTQASTTISVLVEPKVYISAGSVALIDGGNATTVATCIAERALPSAEVSWESDLFGTSEAHMLDEVNGTITTQVHYTWQPTRHAQGHALTCVVRHPALQSDFRIPYLINVQFAPDIQVSGYDGDWYVGRENVQLKCRAKANPPAHQVRWIRLDGDMPEGVEMVNSSLVFGRPLHHNDSGVYRCEVSNDIGLRSRDMRIRVQDPPSTTMLSTTRAPMLKAGISAVAPGEKHLVLLNSPTLAPLPEGSLGTVVGGAVGGALFLMLLLVLGGIYFQRQRRTFRGDYYTKQYLGPSDMQKPPQHYGGGPQRSSSNTKFKSSQGNGTICVDKDREEWGDFEQDHSPSGRSGYRKGGLDPNHVNYHQSHHTLHHPNYPHSHHPNPQQDLRLAHNSLRSTHQLAPHKHTEPPGLNNSSQYFPEDIYDSEYVSHVDGSVISRREWYV
ncbi:nectin-3-like protein [Chanos chanos]|uniref:Nectin cell adhesion molecule 3 n=1 Tax=Chanos chanos TaxID=29144 RepID=A0A6J2W3T0_CHACN|nr:nectin-3-like protein [Chanos chanos]